MQNPSVLREHGQKSSVKRAYIYCSQKTHISSNTINVATHVDAIPEVATLLAEANIHLSIPYNLTLSFLFCSSMLSDSFLV